MCPRSSMSRHIWDGDCFLELVTFSKCCLFQSGHQENPPIFGARIPTLTCTHISSLRGFVVYHVRGQTNGGLTRQPEAQRAWRYAPRGVYHAGGAANNWVPGSGGSSQGPLQTSDVERYSAPIRFSHGSKSPTSKWVVHLPKMVPLVLTHSHLATLFRLLLLTSTLLQKHMIFPLTWLTNGMRHAS